MTIHDRYSASGRPRPDPKTMCRACEGMGFNPKQRPKDPAADDLGYVFERCDKCGGSGRRDGKGEPISDAGIQSAAKKVKKAISG